MSKKKLPIVLAVLIIILGALYFSGAFRKNAPVEVTTEDGQTIMVASFSDCVAAGLPVTGTSPEICTAPNGQQFANQVPRTISTAPSKVGYLSGKVTIEPVCSTGTAPCQTPESAYTSREVVVRSTDLKTVKGRSAISAEGAYKVTLAPGTYAMQVLPVGVGPSELMRITVSENKTTTQDLRLRVMVR